MPPTALLTPLDGARSHKVAGRLYRKQVLPVGKKITFTDPTTGAPVTLDFTADYLAKIVDSFNAGAYDSVKFQLADAKNSHTEDPERARGTVRAFELTDAGLDMIVEATSEGAKVIEDNPDLGVSARIEHDLSRADGQRFPVAIRHVLGTLAPRVTGLTPWQAVDLASDPTVPTVDLTAESYTDQKGAGMDPAKLREALGLKADATDTEVQAALAAANLTPTAPTTPVVEPVEISDDELAAALAALDEPQPVGASLSAEAQQAIDLANSRAEQASEQVAQLRTQAAQAAWTAESSQRLAAGTPKALLDLAAPWCGAAAPAGFIDLAATDTTVEQVRDAAAADMRKLLDQVKGFIDLSIIGETPDGGPADATARQDAARAYLRTIGA